MIDLNTDTEYLSAKAEYLASVQVAERAGDELAVLKAENAWLRREGELKAKIESRELGKQKKELAIERVKTEYPLVPPSLYEHIEDPEALLAVAKDIHEKMENQVRRNTSSWGNTGAPAATGTQNPTRKSRDRQYVDNLIDRVNRNEGGPMGAAKEYKDMVWRERVMPWKDLVQGGGGSR